MTYDIDTSSLGGAVESFGRLVAGALGLRETAFSTVDQVPAASDVAVAIVLLAGVSQLLGQSVALFLNRVRPLRFVLSMLLAAGLFVAGVVVFALAVWAAAAILVDEGVSLSRSAGVVALGHAPYLLSFFMLLPYYGPGLERLLGVWTVASIAVGLRAALGFDLLEVVLAIGVGFLFMQIAKLLVGRWIERLTEWLRLRVSGSAAPLTLEDVVEGIEEQASRDAQRWFGT